MKKLVNNVCTLIRWMWLIRRVSVMSFSNVRWWTTCLRCCGVLNLLRFTAFTFFEKIYTLNTTKHNLRKWFMRPIWLSNCFWQFSPKLCFLAQIYTTLSDDQSGIQFKHFNRTKNLLDMGQLEDCEHRLFWLFHFFCFCFPKIFFYSKSIHILKKISAGIAFMGKL